MKDRVLQYAAAALVAIVLALLVVGIGALSEGHTGPSGETPAGEVQP